MLSRCPHCQNDLNLTEAQRAKVKQALAALPAGKTLKIGCPHCKERIELRRDGSAGEGSAAGQSVMKDVLYSEHRGAYEEEVSSLVEKTRAPVPQPARLPPTAPKAPDVGWLADGEFVEKEIVRDVPLALILMPQGPGRDAVTSAFEGLGYQVEYADSPATAIERMRFVNFAAVVLHTGFEGGPPEESEFHNHMAGLAMARRRAIYYVLIGPAFHTLYDLEALTLSANLVVNDNELPHLGVILKKGLADYDDLFGPYLAALKEQGKK